jgi:hypothetical protein
MWSAFASGYDPVIVSHDGSVELGGVEILERKRARPSVLDGMGVASGRVLGCSWTHQIAHRWHEHGGRGQLTKKEKKKNEILLSVHSRLEGFSVITYDPAHIGRARRLMWQFVERKRESYIEWVTCMKKCMFRRTFSARWPAKAA